MPAQIVEHDISAFLADEFRKIRHSFNLTVADERPTTEAYAEEVYKTRVKETKPPESI
jgi:hypothetical protein